MQVTVTIPEDIGQALASTAVTIERAALEGLAAEGYRSGALSETQVMRLLEIFRRALPSISGSHSGQIPYRYSEADLACDLTNLSELGLR